MSPNSKLVVVGLGYIGLPTAALFASEGFEVVGVDTSTDVIDALAQGRPHIVEPGLDELVASVVQNGRLRPSLTPEPADAFIIAVPTPFLDDLSPDLSFVRAAAQAIAPHLRSGSLVVIESTCPVGTTESVAAMLADLRTDLVFPAAGGDPSEAADIAVAYCPERVLPGNILKELRHNDRIVGGLTGRCAVAAAELYERVVVGACNKTSARTAELAKLSENAFRDVNIAFANELSLVADRLGIDVWELIDLANLHPRVQILKPGAGVGGHCIAVDPWFIVDSAPEDTALIRAARQVNDQKPEWVAHRALELLDTEGDAPPLVLCLGLTYKPDSDDLRSSPALAVVHALADRPGLRVAVAEPNLATLPESLTSVGVEHVVAADTVASASLVIGLVGHAEFEQLAPGSAVTVLDVAGLWT